MIDPNLEARIQRHLDGDLAPAEVEELRETLAKDAQAQQFQARMEQLASRLADVGLVDPPPGLRSEILRAVSRAEREHEAAPAPSGSWRLASPSRVRLSRRDAYAFFCGAVLVAALVAAVVVSGRAPRLDTDALRGTMAADAGPRDWTLRERQSIEGADLKGRAQVSTTGAWIEVTLELSAAEETDILLEFDGSNLVPMSFERVEPGPGLDIGSGRVHFKHVGASSYRIVLRSNSEMEEPLPLRLRQVLSPSTLRLILNTPSGDD